MDIGFLMAATAECGDLAEIARSVEAHGYGSLWIAEHPVIPIGMKTAFPFTPDHKLPTIMRDGPIRSSPSPSPRR
jgi:alkanesulfonate monooxygenase SsuD/methylene tetrahydromethanopterin reductase-like flavin-dependent oxidoreductase (luciferase family)